MAKKRKISFNFNYESAQEPEVLPPLPVQSVIQQVQQPAIHPQYTPTLLEPPLQPISEVVLAPTLVDEATQYRRGAIVSCAIVCALVGVQIIYPPAWNWVESQRPVKELQKVFSGVTFAEKQKKLTYTNLGISPKKGEIVAGYPISSPWGWRGYIGEGKSKFHQGVDIATPIGTPAFAIAGTGETVRVLCWHDPNGGGLVASLKSQDLKKGFDYLHLRTCKPGIYQAGDPIAATGDSGTAKGQPHLHLSQRDETGKKEPPNTEFVKAALKP